MLHTKKRQIILVRHAKAIDTESWDGDDFDRPLHEKGCASMKVITNYLSLIGVRPDVIIASPSVRTRDTAEFLQKKFASGEIELYEDLYNANRDASLDANEIHLSHVRNVSTAASTLMIVGHNPDLSDFAQFLSGESVPSMKKGAVIILSIPEGIEWRKIKKGSLNFVYYMTPEFLRLEDLEDQQ